MKHGYLVSGVFVSSAAAPASVLLILRHVFTLLLLDVEVVFANIFKKNCFILNKVFDV